MFFSWFFICEIVGFQGPMVDVWIFLVGWPITQSPAAKACCNPFLALIPWQSINQPINQSMTTLSWLFFSHWNCGCISLYITIVSNVMKCNVILWYGMVWSVFAYIYIYIYIYTYMCPLYGQYIPIPMTLGSLFPITRSDCYLGCIPPWHTTLT